MVARVTTGVFVIAFFISVVAEFPLRSSVYTGVTALFWLGIVILENIRDLKESLADLS